MTLPRLMLVTGADLFPSPDAGDAAALAAAGSGVPLLIQLRERERDGASRAALALRLRETLAEGSVLVVNGDEAAARQAGAGLHLPAAAPRPADPPRPFGRSAHDDHELGRAAADGCDYAVAGPVFPTTSKPGARTLGLAGLTRLAGAAPLPLFAIGGFGASRAGDAIASGAHGVAVRSAILLAPSPADAVREIAHALDAAARRAPGAIRT